MEHMETIDFRLGTTGLALQMLKTAIDKNTTCIATIEPGMRTINPPIFSKTLAVWCEKNSIGFTVKHSRDGRTDIHLYRDDPSTNLPNPTLPHLLILPGELGMRTVINKSADTFEVPDLMDYEGLMQVLLEQFPDELAFLNNIDG